MNKYGNPDYPSSLYYKLVHGDFVDISIWKPKSDIWKFRIRIYRMITKTDYFPSRIISEMFEPYHKCYDISYKYAERVELRAEFVQRLKSVFIDDAIERSKEKYGYELTREKINSAIRNAKNNLANYSRRLQLQLGIDFGNEY